MSAARHMTATVLPGRRIEVTAPDLVEGETVELYIVPVGAPVTPATRQAFLRLPMAERRRILAEQAAEQEQHYREDGSWREIQGGDIVEY